MALSEEERQALRAKAANLRVELTNHTARRDEAFAAASREREDAALLAEVQSLETQVEAAAQQADAAEVSVGDAAAVMLAAARQGDAVQEGDPTGSSPALPATDNTTPDKLQGPTESNASFDLTPTLIAEPTGKEGSK